MRILGIYLKKREKIKLSIDKHPYCVEIAMKKNVVDQGEVGRASAIEDMS